MSIHYCQQLPQSFLFYVSIFQSSQCVCSFGTCFIPTSQLGDKSILLCKHFFDQVEEYLIKVSLTGDSGLCG